MKGFTGALYFWREICNIFGLVIKIMWSKAFSDEFNVNYFPTLPL